MIEIYKPADNQSQTLSWQENISSAKSVLLPLEKEENALTFNVEPSSLLHLEIVNFVPGKMKLQGKITLQESAELEIAFVDFSSGDVEVSFDVEVNASAKARIDVAVAAGKKTQKTFDFRLKHIGGSSYSFTKMYGVLTDSAHLTFLGTSDIVKGARKTWTRQEGRIADLSVDGVGQVSPILKIDEDDVKASHGAALGKVNEEALFYMMSRGLSKDQAMGLMTLGYLKPIVMEISDESTRGKLLDFVEKRNFTYD
jgi:Fe-S cluster assembly protein SufD